MLEILIQAAAKPVRIATNDIVFARAVTGAATEDVLSNRLLGQPVG
ncbi:hypothetical protein [Silvibacterium acidisoli]